MRNLSFPKQKNKNKMAHLGLTGDFPMPNRADLMSLQTINQKKDAVATTTKKFTSMRTTSNNLHTGDIQGKSTADSNN